MESGPGGEGENLVAVNVDCVETVPPKAAEEEAQVMPESILAATAAAATVGEEETKNEGQNKEAADVASAEREDGRLPHARVSSSFEGSIQCRSVPEYPGDENRVKDMNVHAGATFAYSECRAFQFQSVNITFYKLFTEPFFRYTKINYIIFIFTIYFFNH